LARLLERAGSFHIGSITLIATVLSDGGDEREPLSDAARAALDGHIVLSTDIARSGRYPAIDVLASTSRTMNDVVQASHRRAAARVRQTLALLARTADARDLGFAVPTPELERAVADAPAIDAFLRQESAAADPGETIATLHALGGAA
jgi:flagellum-specific ATP synthase